GAPPQQANEILSQLPSYWGEQPIVAAPAYIGAVVIFLAILALFLVKGRLKWWVTAAFILSLFLSWGKNLSYDDYSFLTEFFIKNVPLYSKFRAVSSIQVIIELILPVLAVVGLHQFFSGFERNEEKKKALLYSAGITGGVALLFILFKSTLLDFSNSFYDANIRENLSLPVLDAVREDRAAMLTSDAIRSLIFVVLSGGTLWLFLKGKLKEITVISVLAVLIVVDLVGVDRRYVNNDDFVQARVMEHPFQKNGADLQIEKDEGFYRVYDATTNAFNSGRASYYHNALGGYHAAKPGRIQDLNEFYISRGNIGMLNMLNVKYIITQGKNGGAVAQRNPYANGNAWFVENVILADNANDELLLLDSLDTKKTAIIHSKFKEELPVEKISRDSTAMIDLVKQEPQHLVYETATKSPQLAIFSEVYYPHGWNAYIDGRPADYYRANYALRAMTIPEGIHKIEFKFQPDVVEFGSTLSLFSSIVFVILLLGGGYLAFKYNKTEKEKA
ncbi:MAG TPA: hypothetical protein DEG69_15420, partial [Flavobacteriaceae bacterium]|nr:hypothetical protein [Flavobacteriaceae bacterium]